jgi:hypothetical protein
LDERREATRHRHGRETHFRQQLVDVFLILWHELVGTLNIGRGCERRERKGSSGGAALR